jgi:hypothetical protein
VEIGFPKNHWSIRLPRVSISITPGIEVRPISGQTHFVTRPNHLPYDQISIRAPGLLAKYQLNFETLRLTQISPICFMVARQQ